MPGLADCPKCHKDISDTYESADPSVGIMSAGYYCDDCDEAVPHDGECDFGDSVGLIPEKAESPVGTPFSELSGQPGNTEEQRARYENFKRIARSWGYD